MASSHESTPDPELTTPAPELLPTEASSATQAPTLPQIAETMRPNAGAVLFGRYRVERELGRGGMGRVVLAFDIKLHLHVALKLIPEHLVPDRESVNDFRQEVHRGMALMHPGIVRTHTFELDETGAAVVMEFVDGQTLADLREDQPERCFDTDQLLPWVASLCEIIDYAHREARIVHRDMKPRNVMLTREGRLKVADFGIAATLTDTYTRNTGKEPGSGTPPYMSPQQAKGKRPEPSDDIYSLGATLYDLLTGKPPFFRGPHQAIVMQVCSVVPPPIAERRAELGVTGKLPVPSVWEDTIAACLAKDPEHRPTSAAMVLARLRGEASTASPIPATTASDATGRSLETIASPATHTDTPSPGGTRRWWPWLALCLCLVLAGAGARWYFLLEEGADESAAEFIPSQEDRQTLARARVLLSEQKPDEAAALLARFPDGYAPADSLRTTVAQRIAEAAKRADEARAAKVAELLAQSDTLKASGDIPGARAIVYDILKTHDPTNPVAWARLETLDAQSKTIDEARRAAEAAELVVFTESYNDADQALAAGELDRVEPLLANVPAAYVNSPKLAELRQRLSLARTAAAQAARGQQQRETTTGKRSTSTSKKPIPTRKPVPSGKVASANPPPLPPKATPSSQKPPPRRKPNFLTM